MPLVQSEPSGRELTATLLAQIETALLSCIGDGGYDKRPVYQALQEHSPEAQAVIPPRHDAHIWQHANSKAERLKRDENVRYIRQHGRRKWKEACGYYRRSLAETLMFRVRSIFGDRPSAQCQETQVTQALIRCRALNSMTYLTMPDSYLVA
jgi:DDE family transposase